MLNVIKIRSNFSLEEILISRWSFFQIITVLLLICSMFVADLFKKNITNSVELNQVGLPLPAYMTILFIVAIVGCFYLITIFQFQKNPSILSHPIWRKMHIITISIFTASLLIFVTLIVVTPLDEWIQKWRGLLYLIMIYFFFLIYWFMLSIVNKYMATTMSKTNKINVSFAGTAFLLIVIIFFLPSI